MSVSVNYSKLQQVEAFAEFLDLLSKPQELAKLFNDLRAERTAYEQVVSAKAKIADVDAYVTKAEQDILDKYNACEEKQIQVDLRVKALEDLERAKAKQIEEADAALAKRTNAVTEQEQEARRLLAEAEVLNKKAQEANEFAQNAAKEAMERAADLQAKQEAIRKLMGE